MQLIVTHHAKRRFKQRTKIDLPLTCDLAKKLIQQSTEVERNAKEEGKFYKIHRQLRIVIVLKKTSHSLVIITILRSEPIRSKRQPAIRKRRNQWTKNERR